MQNASTRAALMASPSLAMASLALAKLLQDWGLKAQL
jgi:hypothetical protein